MSEKLWTRHVSHFIVEIQVGRAWSHYMKTESQSEALAACSKAIADKAVTTARVLEHTIEHKCSLVHTENQAAVLRIPPKMQLTGRLEPCPLCTKQAPVTHDGHDDWVFCGPCDRAFPSRAA